MRNEKYPNHAQHRDDPDEFIPADVIADISDLPERFVQKEPVRTPVKSLSASERSLADRGTSLSIGAELPD